VGDLPIKLVGHNPGIAGAEAASSWDALREEYRSHRAYVHTAGRGLDDGYNLGLVEAMVTGMPVVSSALAESPIEHGKNGLIDDQPARLHAGLAALLADRARALELGKRARETALEKFSVAGFVDAWRRALELAIKRWAARS
jgi:glycosyltransferase involved in cell wall biosynthesis